MTPEIFAFFVMPGLVILTGLVGYAVIALTDRDTKASEAANMGKHAV